MSLKMQHANITLHILYVGLNKKNKIFWFKKKKITSEVKSVVESVRTRESEWMQEAKSGVEMNASHLSPFNSSILIGHV